MVKNITVPIIYMTGSELNQTTHANNYALTSYLQINF